MARIKEQIARLEQERDKAVAEVQARWTGIADRVEESEVHPSRSGIHIKVFGLAWVPYWLLGGGEGQGGEAQRLPAYPL